jgi:putative ABC transport system ATP-binding protein
MNLIAGLLKPTSGSVFVGEVEISRLSQDEAAVFRRRNVGIVFQFFNLIPMLNLEENVALPLLLDGLYLESLRGRIERLLERLDIADRRHQAIDELSGGEIQRAAIARALLAEPKLILADEPTGNLGSTSGDQVLSLLREVSKERGTTTILFTHDLRAVSFADRVISLRDGRIGEDLTPKTGRPVS